VNRCRECGLFCSCGAMWPWGMCLHSGDRLIEATKQACLVLGAYLNSNRI